jgi:hypothetical protein
MAGRLPSTWARKEARPSHHTRRLARGNRRAVPKPFLRGLIHSDGSRTVNRFSVALRAGRREYAYPRYFFTNLSADIRDLFCAACEQLDICWSQSSYKNISVAERRSVKFLDSFIGPKSNAGGGT